MSCSILLSSRSRHRPKRSSRFLAPIRCTPVEASPSHRPSPPQRSALRLTGCVLQDELYYQHPEHIRRSKEDQIFLNNLSVVSPTWGPACQAKLAHRFPCFRLSAHFILGERSCLIANHPKRRFAVMSWSVSPGVVIVSAVPSTVGSGDNRVVTGESSTFFTGESSPRALLCGITYLLPRCLHFHHSPSTTARSDCPSWLHSETYTSAVVKRGWPSIATPYLTSVTR